MRGLLDVKPAYLLVVKQILRRHVPEREVRVFGSRVTGKAKTFSDLDLAIMGDTPIMPQQWTALVDAFDESELPFKVDLVDWATTSGPFRAIIERDAVELPA